MARKGILGRAIVLLIVNIILFIGMVIWFDFLGIIDIKNIVSPVYALFGAPVRNYQMPDTTLLLLEEERAKKQLDALEFRAQELDKRELDLKTRDDEILQKVQELNERQKSLDDKAASLELKTNEFNGREANIAQNARYVINMPPENAVKILLAMQDQDVIDILRQVEVIALQEGSASIVPYWLSLMPPERAATIQRKMTEKPLTFE